MENITKAMVHINLIKPTQDGLIEDLLNEVSRQIRRWIYYQHIHNADNKSLVENLLKIRNINSLGPKVLQNVYLNSNATER